MACGAADVQSQSQVSLIFFLWHVRVYMCVIAKVIRLDKPGPIEGGCGETLI